MLNGEEALEVINCPSCGVTQEMKIGYASSDIFCSYCGEEVTDELEERGYIFD